MAIRDIVLYPDAPLTLIAQPVERVGPEIESLVADMFETMHAFDGSGLAAPQVGVGIRLCVLFHPVSGKEMCLINPELSEPQGSVTAEEGCLSLPNVYAMVPRAQRMRVQAQDLRGEPVDLVAEEWLARIIQHEVDHLNGKAFPDRLDLLSREDKLREWREMRELMRAAVERRSHAL